MSKFWELSWPPFEGDYEVVDIVKESETFPLAFKWNDCFEGEKMVIMKNLEVKPDPIHPKENISVAVDVSLMADANSPIPVSLEIKKKVGPFWVKVPCIDGKGSCDYADACKKLGDTFKCPDAFKKNNIPCHCPFKKGDYHMPLSDFGPIDSGSFQIPSGDYKFKVVLKDSSNTEKGCFAFELTIA